MGPGPSMVSGIHWEWVRGDYCMNVLQGAVVRSPWQVGVGGRAPAPGILEGRQCPSPVKMEQQCKEASFPNEDKDRTFDTLLILTQASKI